MARNRQKNKEMSAFHLYGKAGPDQALAHASLDTVEPIRRSSALYDYSNIAGNISVREGLTRDDYDLMRPGDRVPNIPKAAIWECLRQYKRNGILKQVIDMMASFGCQGIEILHPVKSREKAYRHWFQKVNGPEVSQHFLRMLYAAGNVYAKRGIAKLKASDIKDLQRGFATTAPDETYERSPKPKKNEIPISYRFLNPIHVELVHGELATFLGHQVYMLRIPTFLMTMIRTPKSPTEQQLIADLPSFIREPIQRGERYILLDNDKMAVYHYMKDDWEQWAHPMAYSVLSDLKLYEKMKLADEAALDGAISKIRLWKLGSMENKIQAGPAMFQKLHDVLMSQTGGGSMDLIWDDAIELVETSTDISKFLGNTKYEPVLQAIYAGLGIPQSLTGGGEGAGFTNNAISLKTLIERLQYGRMLLTRFWQNELRILQEALGDKKPAQVVYDNMTLYDEAAEKMVWVQLVDRDIVSVETMQERFGLIPEVEQMRMKRENTMRESDSGKVPQKAGPFHNAQFQQDVTHTSLQQGTIAPSEAGVKKKPKAKGDKSLMDHQTALENKRIDMEKEKNDQQMQFDQELQKQKLQQNDDVHNQRLKQKDAEHKTMLPVKKQALKQQLSKKNKGQPQQGRPKNSKDTKQRKKRQPQPSTKAMFDMMMWAREAQKTIAEAYTPMYLDKVNKKNVRTLTSAQVDELEDAKLSILWSLEPMGAVSDISSMQDTHILSLPKIDRNAIVSEMGKADAKLTLDQERELYIQAYVLEKGDFDGEADD